ncbi:hypothetical protein [Methylobacterium sp. GC_Met_1]|uniref:hypothetical protein n=1 Tax=Methylobacterium sp. GC_Met_1 TaxID=2937377 RepID=UPI00226AB301|nr:hypothetical protein [Methylobacterium sp. GC_Met_1]
MPEIHAIGEADLDRSEIVNAAALVFLDAGRFADGFARIAGLKKRRPNLRPLVVFDALTAGAPRALLVAGADTFVGHAKSPRDLGAALLAVAEGADRLGLLELGCAFRRGRRPRADAARGGGAALAQLQLQQQEVARRLDLSVRTVATQRLNLRR